MTAWDLIGKYGPNELRAASAEVRHLEGMARVAKLMERFGRDWHHVDLMLLACDGEASRLGLLSRIRRWLGL